MKKISKIDLFILIGIVVGGIVLSAVFFLSKKPGSIIVVSVDGKEIDSYLLSENVETIIRGVGGTNRLVINDGEAWVEEADCPDKLCVEQGKISQTGESIICLPHRVSVRVVGEADDEVPDAIAE